MREEDWREFYRKTYHMFRETAQYSWGMVKFYLLTASAFITITLGGVIGIISLKETLLNNSILMGYGILMLNIFPIFMISILELGKKNFQRECERGYEQVAILMKLETKYNFTYEPREKDEKKRLFSKDIYFTPDRWKENEWQSETDYKKWVMEKEDSYYFATNQILVYFQRFSTILFIILLVIGAAFISYPDIFSS